MTRPCHLVNRRALASPRAASRLDTSGLRANFLVDNFFGPSELRIVVTDMDRVALGSPMPSGALCLPPGGDFGADYFTERRELGLVNLGIARENQTFTAMDSVELHQLR